MAVGRGAVGGLAQAAEELGAQGVALRVVGQNLEQADELLALGEVGDADAVGGELLAELVEFVGVGVVVHAVERGEFFAFGEAGEGLVGGEHELLDELVALVVLDALEAVGVALGVHEDLGLGHVEVERAVGHAVAAQARGEFPELAHPALERGELLVGERGEGATGGAGLVFGREGELADGVERVGEEQGVGLLVGEALVAADDGVGVNGVVGEEAALGVEVEEDGLAQAILALDERAEAVGQLFREHGHDGADEVGGVAALEGLLVEGGAGLHVGGDVGDVDADAQAAPGERFEREGVVKVLGVVGVDGEDGALAVVEAADALLGLDGVGDAGDLALDLGREGRVELVFAINAEELGAGLEGFAQHLGDDAAERFARIVPRLEGGDDLVVELGGGFEAGERGVGDEDLERETRVVGEHDVLGAHAGEAADDLGAGALDDAGDAAARFGVARVAGGEAAAAQGGVDLHRDDVAGQGGEGVAGVDLDAVGAGSVGVGLGIERGDDKGGAAGAEHDAAEDLGAVVGGGGGAFFGGGGGRGGLGLGEGVAVALDLGDLALGQHQAQLVQEAGAQFLGEFQLAEESGVVDRAVAGGAEDGENGGAEGHGRWRGDGCGLGPCLGGPSPDRSG